MFKFPLFNTSIVVVFYLFIIINRVNGQSVYRFREMHASGGSYTDTLSMRGFLDRENTVSRITNNETGETGFDRIWTFEPMIKVIIENEGTAAIKPRLVFNNRNNFYELRTWLNQITLGAKTAKEKILRLRQYLIDNRVHYLPSSPDDYRYNNMLLGYGYGTCDVVTNNFKLFADSLGYSTKRVDLPHHVFADVRSDSVSGFMDSDIEGLYLNLDNSTIASFSDLIEDKYLVTRTHHYGSSVRFDKKIDSFVSRIFYTYPFPTNSKYKSFFGAYKGGGDNNFTIFPGGSITFDWKDAESYLHYWDGNDQVPSTFKRYVFANGKYTYKTNFLTAPIDQLSLINSNLKIGGILTLPNIYAFNSEGYFSVSQSLPFPIIKANISCLINIESLGDYVEVFLSNNNITWLKLANFSKVGRNWGTIGLDSLVIQDYYGYKIPSYKYFLKFVFHPTTGSACGLDSLTIDNTFEINRLIMPSLVKGINNISYSDPSYDNATSLLEHKSKITIHWQESSENHPPNPPSYSIFPLDGAEVDSLYFGFQWSPALDPNGLAIVDYEFILSDNSNMLYPLSSNFNMYVSALNSEIKPCFKVKETGWLNVGKKYYWQVRAKNSKGIWSEWSQVWSFTPQGVMRPLNLNCSVIGDSILLNWNLNFLGKTPDFYKIYWSNQYDGFTPNISSFLDTTNKENYVFVFNGKNDSRSSFRVTACTKDGQESTPSNYANLPNLTLISYLDSISPDSLYSLKLKVNERYSPFYYYKEDTLYKNESLTYEKIPYWLVTNKSNNAMGFATYDIARRMNFVDSLSKVKVKVIADNGEKEFDLNLVSRIKNQSPSLVAGKNIAYVGKLFSSFVTTIDGDVNYGDINKFKILKKPDWINYTVIGDSILISGTPKESNIKDDEIDIEATDSKRLLSKMLFKIKTYAISENVLSFFPNPIKENGFIIINNAEDLNLEISLYTIEGFNLGMIHKGFYKKGIHQIPISTSSLNEGFYFFKYKISGKISSYGEIKFIKQ